jgi:hypothetical protein
LKATLKALPWSSEKMFKRLRHSEHKRVGELLSAYIDGELSIEEATLVERHLRDCSTCTQDLETLRQTVNLVQQLPAISPPRSFTISHLVVPERRWAWGYVYLRGATALTALLLIVLLAGDLGFQHLWAPRIAAPVPEPMALKATVEAQEAEVEVFVETPPARAALDQVEAQKVEETPLAEATLPAERLGAALPSPEPTPTPELVAAAESPLPSPIPEGTAYAVERPERSFAFLSTLRLLEGALLGAFLILGGATVLVAWRRMVSQR